MKKTKFNAVFVRLAIITLIGMIFVVGLLTFPVL